MSKNKVSLQKLLRNNERKKLWWNWRECRQLVKHEFFENETSKSCNVTIHILHRTSKQLWKDNPPLYKNLNDEECVNWSKDCGRAG